MKLYPRPQGTAYLLRDLLRSTLVKSVAYKYLSEYCGHRAVVVSTVARTQARASYWPPIEKCDGDRALRPLRRKNEVFDSGCAPVPVLTLAYRGGPGLPRYLSLHWKRSWDKNLSKIGLFRPRSTVGLMS